MDEYNWKNDDRRLLPQQVVLPGWVNIMGSVMGILLTFGVGYIITSVTNLQNQTTDIQTQVVIIQTQLKDVGRDRYKSSDATRDFALRDQTIQSLKAQFNVIERKLDKNNDNIDILENQFYKKYSGVK